MGQVFETDLRWPIASQLCFGVPVHQWISVFAAIKADIENAKAMCGGDGMGCKGFRGHNADCPRCPMETLATIRESLDGALQ